MFTASNHKQEVGVASAFATSPARERFMLI